MGAEDAADMLDIDISKVAHTTCNAPRSSRPCPCKGRADFDHRERLGDPERDSNVRVLRMKDGAQDRTITKPRKTKIDESKKLWNNGSTRQARIAI